MSWVFYKLQIHYVRESKLQNSTDNLPCLYGFLLGKEYSTLFLINWCRKFRKQNPCCFPKSTCSPRSTRTFAVHVQLKMYTAGCFRKLIGAFFAKCPAPITWERREYLWCTNCLLPGSVIRRAWKLMCIFRWKRLMKFQRMFSFYGIKTILALCVTIL